MNLNALTRSSSKLMRVLTRNSPTILTALSVAGLISTVILAVKATPKAMKILEYEEDFRWYETQDSNYKQPIDVLDAVQLTWKCYIPPAVMGGMTIVCIIGANSINLRRNAVLASLFSITETTLKEYQSKVIERIGEGKEDKIRGEIAQNKLDANPLDGKAVVVTNNGSMLCYDSLSGRYFYSDIESIRKCQNDFNKRLMSDMVISLNEFYDDLGLDAIDIGASSGWMIEKGMVDMFFGAKLTKEGKPCIVIEHRNLPTNIWK